MLNINFWFYHHILKEHPNKKNLSLISDGFARDDLIKLLQKASLLNKENYLDYSSRCKKYARLNYSIENSLDLHCNLFTDEKR